ncbi:MAG: penicillin-binding protein 2 [Eubacteriales bacterium]|nr:penicillin-binding protein 2 [Eubacteriales bacterium]
MQKKLVITVSAVALALFGLAGRIYLIQRDNSENYNKIVLSQRQSEYVSQTIPYKRGDIFDRNGNRLAYSEKVYNLIIDPKQMIAAEGDTSSGQAAVYDVVNTTVDAISEYFGADRGEVLAAVEGRPDSSYVRYLREISYDQRQGFLAYCDQKKQEYESSDDPNQQKKRIRGVWFEDEYRRKYPYGALACNVIGFASGDGASGNGGVEQYYNDSLIGTNGREYGYLDDEANLERVIKPAEDGSSLVLTIDSNLQNIVEKYLKEWKDGDIGSLSAACVMLNPKNGEVLAMASTNSFDLNNPRDTGDYTEEELYALGLKEAVGVYRRENPDSPSITEEQVPEHFERAEIISYGTQVAWNRLWRNICVSDTFEPGSTQKIFTVGGAMEEGLISAHTTFNCEGNIKLSDGVHTWQINCVNRNGHGLLDITGGITQSCNVVMMNIAFLEGNETFLKYQHIFGFGDYTGIDLPAEANTTDLVFNAENMGKTSLATNSFGQNYNCTMIQMAAAYASVVNGGYYYEPHVVKQILNSEGAVTEDKTPVLVRETISQSTCNFLKEALFETVETGTGKAAGVEGYHVGGKTGTAQKLPRAAKNYLVSFCGFAPVEDPQVVCYVIVDQPSLPGEAQAHSSFASQIFSKIMAETLPTLNLYPDGMDASEYRAPSAVLPDGGEGDAQTVMGSQAAGTDGTEAETNADGTPVSTEAQTDSAGNPIENATTAAPATDEFIQGDDTSGGELPDELPAGMVSQESSLADEAAAESLAAAQTEASETEETQ